VNLDPNEEQPHEIPETPYEPLQNDDEVDWYAAWLQQLDRK
jgi:hypothetical protein